MKKSTNIKELDNLIRVILKQYHNEKINIISVFSRSRIRPLPEIRFLFLHFSRFKYSRRLFSDVFLENYINRQHGSLDHANKYVNNMLTTDKDFQKLYESLKSELLK
jgi:hypothetical protein